MREWALTLFSMILLVLFDMCAPTGCAYRNEEAHKAFLAACHKTSHIEGAMERTVCYARGIPTDHGYIFLRSLNCYKCTGTDTETCYSEGDEP